MTLSNNDLALMVAHSLDAGACDTTSAVFNGSPGPRSWDLCGNHVVLDQMGDSPYIVLPLLEVVLHCSEASRGERATFTAFKVLSLWTNQYLYSGKHLYFSHSLVGFTFSNSHIEVKRHISGS